MTGERLSGGVWDELHKMTGLSVSGYHLDEHHVRHIRLNNWSPYGRGNEKYVCLDLTYNQWEGLCAAILVAHRQTSPSDATGGPEGTGTGDSSGPVPSG